MKVIVGANGRTFECYVCNDMKNHANVNICEVVRPKWKIFRTKYRDTLGFWVSEFDSIFEGVTAVVWAYIGNEEADEELSKKWREFERG